MSNTRRVQQQAGRASFLNDEYHGNSTDNENEDEDEDIALTPSKSDSFKSHPFQQPSHLQQHPNSAPSVSQSSRSPTKQLANTFNNNINNPNITMPTIDGPPDNAGKYQHQQQIPLNSSLPRGSINSHYPQDNQLQPQQIPQNNPNYQNDNHSYNTPSTQHLQAPLSIQFSPSFNQPQPEVHAPN